MHVDLEAPQRIGRGVTVGHGVIMHGIEIGDYSLIGMGSRLLGGCAVGEFCLIGAGAMVMENQVIPPRSVVFGVPGKVRRQVTGEEVEAMKWRSAHYVERARTYLAPPDSD